MPSYNQIAILKSATGLPLPSRYTGSDSLDLGILFISVSGTSNAPARSMSEFFSLWVPRARRSKSSQDSNRELAFMTCPLKFEDGGQVIDATEQWNPFISNRGRRFAATVIVQGALENEQGDDTDWIFSGTAEFDRLLGTNDGVASFRFYSLDASNQGSSTGARKLFVGRKVQVQSGSPAVNILPTRSAFEDTRFWVRPDPILGQFSQLIIGAEDLLNREPVNTLRLEAYYFDGLENLENLVEFGVDENHIPIEWRIAGTERSGNIVFLNLVATDL